MLFSIIIPIYNRPDELDELLDSLTKQTDLSHLEIVVIEDGSLVTCMHIVEKYQPVFDIAYYYKENSGPGESRNFGMWKAKGDYFVILDSDTIVPPDYIATVRKELRDNYADAYGGPDMSGGGFSDMQKAITYSMTSLLTTGGIRGKKKQVGKFQPRSFNMGISRTAFRQTGGFQPMRVGEDVDLSITLWEHGFSTRLLDKAGVFHKRRSTLKSFSRQVYQFGAARPIIFKRHPSYISPVFWFPALFFIYTVVAFVLAGVSCFVSDDDYRLLLQIPLILWVIYSLLNFIMAGIQFKSLRVGLLSVLTSWIQLYSYGVGFLHSFTRLFILKQQPEVAFPTHFYIRK